MPGTLDPTKLTRRRAIQLGSVTMLAAMTAGGVARARQGATDYTFVVAGLDYREGHDEHNSDVLMVSRVSLASGSVRTVAIPRDLYVDIPGFGADKITRAFHHGYYASGETWEGGATTLADTIGANFGLALDAVVTTTFAGFVQLVDAVGGVEVDNPYEVIDPEAEAAEPGNWTWPAGPQTLSGASALRFVRTRKMDGDDGRVRRQQLVLQGLLARLQQPDLASRLPALIEANRETVQTGMAADVEAALVALLPAIDPAGVAFTLVTDQLWGGTLDTGMWVYQADWSTLPAFVEGYLAGA